MFEWTNIHFEVLYNGLQKALDMMASQLEAPLMLKEKIEDEINAIESEFAGTAESDDTRTFMLLINECTKSDHIFKAFPFGNKKSLNAIGDYDKLRKDVIDFYNS